MKLKIKVKLQRPTSKLPIICPKGDWVDLYCDNTNPITYEKPTAKRKKVDNNYVSYVRFPELKYIPLGVAMELPDGFEAIVAPRSSTPKKYSVIIPHSFGIIDNTYCGNNDEWMLPILPFDKGSILNGNRLCQFRIQLSQKATLWQKIKWLFTSSVEFVEVDNLDKDNRGGFGSTGK